MSELLVTAALFFDSLVEQVLRRVHYSRAPQFLKLFYEEFLKFLVQKGMPVGMCISGEVVDLIKDIKNLNLERE